MSLVVYVATEGVRVPIAARRLAELARRVLRAERVADAMLSIAFVTPAAIARMNKLHLNRKGPTDVIAFGMTGHGSRAPTVGDIYIAPDVARSNARKLSLPVREEIARLVVHGTLHVLGYTHPESESRVGSAMWKRQEALLKRGLPRSGPG